MARNGFAERHRDVDADVNQTLRDRLKAGERFDAIVLDPPKFAPTAAHAERAARAYKDINRLALMLLAPGGVLFTFSCSGGIGADLFHKIVAGAGLDAGVDARSCSAWRPPRPPDDGRLPRRRVPEGPGAAEDGDGDVGGGCAGRGGVRSMRGSNLARCTLKKLFTLRTLASCVNRRCTSAW